MLGPVLNVFYIHCLVSSPVTWNNLIWMMPKIFIVCYLWFKLIFDWLIKHWFIFKPTILKTYIFFWRWNPGQKPWWYCLCFGYLIHQRGRYGSLSALILQSHVNFGGLALSLLSLVLVIVFIIKLRSVVNWLLTGITTCTGSWNFAKWLIKFY